MNAEGFSQYRSLHCLGGSWVCHYEASVVVLSPGMTLGVAFEVTVEVFRFIELGMLYQSCCFYKK